MSKFTHVLAAAVAVISAFFESPAGHALLQQYPHLVPIGAGIAAIGLTYRSPKSTQ